MSNIQRRRTKQIHVGRVAIGGGAPISVQTMTKTDTWDVPSVLRQIEEAAKVGCDIIRLACPEERDALAFREIMRHTPIPVIADIHFNYKLALKAIDAGVDGLRLNPGNIGRREKVEEVTRAARERAISIRIGVNAGSLGPQLEKRVLTGEIGLPEAMCESAMRHVRILEDLDFDLIKISLKASDVLNTVAAYRLLAARCPYPFHVGITESGTLRSGTIKSSVGIGALLLDGLCDTIRVSLTAEPREEVQVGRQILQAVGALPNRGANLISCPTCGRIEIEMQSVVREIENRLQEENIPITVAVMGCAVNGPGESKIADVGVAGGRGVGLIYRKGRFVRKVAEREIIEALWGEIQAFNRERLSREESAKYNKSAPAIS